MFYNKQSFDRSVNCLMVFNGYNIKMESVYDLITQLCKSIYNAQCPSEKAIFPKENLSEKNIKKLRSKAFEVILNKTDRAQGAQDFRNIEYDPLIEIFKYIFILKLCGNYSDRAETLENLLDSLMDDNFESQHITCLSALQFLNNLKRIKSDEETELDIFYYGKPNPVLPQCLNTQKDICQFQVYPIESFIIPEKFMALLNTNRKKYKQCSYTTLLNEMSFSTGFISMPTIGTPQIRYEKNTEANMINQMKYITNLPSIQIYPIDEKEEISYREKRIDLTVETFSNELVSKNYDKCFLEKSLENIDLDCDLKEYRTWESLGALQALKEMPFITEEPGAMIHFMKIKQIKALLHSNIKKSVCLLEEIPLTQFLSDLKLVLLGIQSYSFQYINMIGFKIRKNLTIPDVTAQSLAEICQEVIICGNCFKYLSILVSPDPLTGKLQRESPIFKAMCKSIKEFLLYYQAAISRIFVDEKEIGLLKVLNNVKPLTLLITEVSRLCQRDEHGRCTLGEGSGILTHIYKEVKKVTNSKVALIFYSILKACCEVYFNFLQKWLFEGIYDDEYGEFMIQAQPQYLHNRGHKFWVKGFTINTKAIPDFLSSLTESILNCGKTMRLLRICDPKNSACRYFIVNQPKIRVCLSVAMLREQSLRCQEYEKKGFIVLEKIVSLSSLIQDEKVAEKERADLVIQAQQETLLKLQKQRAERLRKEAEAKRKLLMQLKEQAEQAALHREQEKEAELLSDKLLLEKNLEQEKLQEIQHNADKLELLQYYEELAAAEEVAKMRADWRIRRMKLYDKRVDVLLEKDNVQDPVSLEIENSEDPKVLSADKDTSEEEIGVSKMRDNAEKLIPSASVDADIDKCTASDDENSNVTREKNSESSSNDKLKDSTTNCKDIFEDPLCMNYIYKKNNERSALQDFLREEADKDILDNFNEIKTKVDRPLSLRFSEARYNRMKILQQEYGMTPNNNEPNDPFNSDATTVYTTNYTNTTDTAATVILDELNQNTNETDRLVTDRLETGCVITANAPVGNASSSDDRDKLEDTNQSNFISGKQDDKSDENVRQENIETPMSCTTDNYVLSTITPTSQLQSCEDTSPIDTSESFPMTKSYEESLQKDFTFPELLGFGPNVATPIASTSLTVADVATIDTISLQMYLEKSITIPLRVQSSLVNNAIIKHLLVEHNMLSHFRSLRSYYFLLNGEFAKSLTDSLYSKLYEFSMPIELFNSATLTNILERALTISFSSNFNYKLLSLSAINLPSQLHISDPNALDCLCLNYKVLWPLNIILDDMVMIKYTKVFKFLLMIGRVSWVLQEDFNIMKTERRSATSGQYHKLQLYRHSMTQFINALHNYITCSVLHASWSEFEKDLENSLTVDEVYHSHVAYIKRILSRCMLGASGEKMRSCLNNIFKIILKFHNRLRSQSWIGGPDGHVHPNFKRLERMYEVFLELRTYLVHVALKLTTSGYQPHLIHFLDALNINNLYDLTIKKDT